MLNCRESHIYFSHKCIMMVLQKIPWYDLSIIYSDQISFNLRLLHLYEKPLKIMLEREMERIYMTAMIIYQSSAIFFPFPSIVLYGQYGCTISVFARNNWRINKKLNIKFLFQVQNYSG